MEKNELVLSFHQSICLFNSFSIAAFGIEDYCLLHADITTEMRITAAETVFIPWHPDYTRSKNKCSGGGKITYQFLDTEFHCSSTPKKLTRKVPNIPVTNLIS